MTVTRRPNTNRDDWILADWRRLPAGVGYFHKRGGGRWREWEKRLLNAIRHHSEPALLAAGVIYAQERLSGHWPKLEQLLPSRPAMLEAYLSMNPGRRDYPALEKAILDDTASYPAVRARAAYLYARSAIQGRWAAGEEVILEATKLVADNSNESTTAVAEAAEAYRKVAFGREPWPELVGMIRAGQCHPYFAISYCVRSHSHLRAEVAEGLLNTPVSDEDDTAEQVKRMQLAFAAKAYAQYVIKGRWKAGEKLLSGFPFEMSCYAQFALKHPLPDHMHSEMVMMSFQTPDDPDIKDYLKWCNEWATIAEAPPVISDGCLLEDPRPKAGCPL
jgi:hypothetical protein